MGNDEAVTPVFPNSDYCTGVCGSSGVLEALVRRAESGGSYGVDVSRFRDASRGKKADRML